MLQSMGSQRVGHNLVIEQQGITQGLSDLLPSWWRESEDAEANPSPGLLLTQHSSSQAPFSFCSLADNERSGEAGASCVQDVRPS